MIFYHGTPISGSRDDARAFLKGRHGLVSFAHQDHLHIVKDVCVSYILDNGAFSIWRKGGKLNAEDYIDWAYRHSNTSNFNFAFIPDIIDGKESHNDELINLWRDKVSVPGVPIWHLNESLNKLDRLSREWDTVALGSSGNYATPGAPRWWSRMADAMNAVCDAGAPRCRLHGLRMMSPSIFAHVPFSSVDSTNAAQNALRQARALSLPHSWQGATIIAWRLEQHQTPTTWHGYNQQSECLL